MFAYPLNPPHHERCDMSDKVSSRFSTSLPNSGTKSTTSLFRKSTMPSNGSTIITRRKAKPIASQGLTCLKNHCSGQMSLDAAEPSTPSKAERQSYCLKTIMGQYPQLFSWSVSECMMKLHLYSTLSQLSAFTDWVYSASSWTISLLVHTNPSQSSLFSTKPMVIHAAQKTKFGRPSMIGSGTTCASA